MGGSTTEGVETVAIRDGRAGRLGSTRARLATAVGLVIGVLLIGLLVIGLLWRARESDPNTPGAVHPATLVHSAEAPAAAEDARGYGCPESWSVSVSGHHWRAQTAIPATWWSSATVDGTLTVEARTGLGNVTTAQFTAGGETVQMVGGNTEFLTVGCPAIG